MFMRGFKEVILIAVTLVTIYLALNAFVIGSGVLVSPDASGEAGVLVLRRVKRRLAHRTFAGQRTRSIASIIAVCFLFFPKLALGLSGFETGVAVMPLVKGNARTTTMSSRPAAFAMPASC